MRWPPADDLDGARIWVAGHTGMVGAAVCRRLAHERVELVTATRAQLDLRRQADVEGFVADTRPDIVVVAAAIVGGLQANNAHPVSFLADNLAIAQHTINACADIGVPRLLFLASSCIYPRLAPQPLVEDSLLTAALEPTNQWYAIAKLAGMKLAEAHHRESGLDYTTAIPANLYGPGDNFDPDRSHVIPGLIRRMTDARQRGDATFDIWGSGSPRREFMHVDDAADAIVHVLAHHHEPDPINIGTGADTSITEVAHLIADIVGYDGDLRFDTSKPDGMPRKGLDASKLRELGWSGGRPLAQGVAETHRWFREHVASRR